MFTMHLALAAMISFCSMYEDQINFTLPTFLERSIFHMGKSLMQS